METIGGIIFWLQGKKGVLASIVGAIQAYLAAKGHIGEPEIMFITALSIIFFGSASYVTKKYLNK